MGLNGWNSSFYSPSMSSSVILSNRVFLYRRTTSSLIPSLEIGWEHRCSSTLGIFRHRLSAQVSIEWKIKWCFDMFNTLDNTLTDYILITQPQLQRNDACLDMVEKKIEILVA